MQIEIYFRDLNTAKQQELLEVTGVKTPEDMNWDVMPVTVIEIET